MRSGTFEVTSILPPMCTRNVRSDTLRTSTPGSALTASVSSSAWVCDWALAEMSTTIDAAVDSTTSKPVMTPPARPTAVVRSPAAVADGGAAIRMVIE